MKKIFGLLVLLSAVNANALFCALHKENPNKKGFFDQPVFKNGVLEVLKNGANFEYVLIKSDNSVIEDFKFDSIKTPDDLKAIDKSVVMFVRRVDDQNLLSVGLGKLDISNKDGIMIMTSLAVSSEGKSLTSFDYIQSMALSCVNQ